MRPEAVAARLEVVRRLYRPQVLPEGGAEGRAGEADMSPEAVALRLEELSALDRLARWLQEGAERR